MNATTLRLLLFAAALFVCSADAFVVSAQQGSTGDLSVVGHVGVEGGKGETGDLVFPDSRIHTAKRSSAVVSLGKLGRVELTESTTMFLTFDEESIGIKLSSGAVVVETLAGILATVSTKEAEIISDTSVASRFTVDVDCGNTIVIVDAGYVRLQTAIGKHSWVLEVRFQWANLRAGVEEFSLGRRAVGQSCRGGTPWPHLLYASGTWSRTNGSATLQFIGQTLDRFDDRDHVCCLQYALVHACIPGSDLKPPAQFSRRHQHDRHARETLQKKRRLHSG